METIIIKELSFHGAPNGRYPQPQQPSFPHQDDGETTSRWGFSMNNETALEHLKRPGTLVTAARYGLSIYRRKRDLRHLTPRSHIGNVQQVVATLIDVEDDAEMSRKSGDASYNVGRHIELLTALIAEAALLPKRATRPIA
jgi:hypothetical protein